MSEHREIGNVWDTNEWIHDWKKLLQDIEHCVTVWAWTPEYSWANWNCEQRGTKLS